MSRPSLVRISLVVDGIRRGFVTVLQGKDGSFYFHPSRPPGEPWTTPGTSNSGGRRLLHFDKAVAQTFELNKLTFHKSGYIHVTDRNGKRFRDGLRISPFEELQLPFNLAVFIPCNPGRLPLASTRRGFNIDIVLAPHTIPFHIDFALIDQSVEQVIEQGPFITHPIYLLFEGRRFGLAVTMWPVLQGEDGGPVEWPQFPFFLFRDPTVIPARETEGAAAA